MALHFDATRSTLEQSSALLRQVAAARDPRDFFALASQTQAQIDSVLAYQRKLFGVATSLTSALTGVPPAVTPAASAALEKLAALPPVAEPLTPAFEETVAQPATQPTEVAVELIDAASAPVAAPELPPAEPIAELTPVAAAAGHQEQHPSAAPVQEPTELGTPVEASTPAPRNGGRGRRK
jgi:phasin family protein